MALLGHFDDEVVEVGVAVEVAVIVEKSPVDLLLAKNTLYLSHLPSQLLQQDAYHLHPVCTRLEPQLFSLSFREFAPYLVHQRLNTF